MAATILQNANPILCTVPLLDMVQHPMPSLLLDFRSQSASGRFERMKSHSKELDPWALQRIQFCLAMLCCCRAKVFRQRTLSGHLRADAIWLQATIARYRKWCLTETCCERRQIVAHHHKSAVKLVDMEVWAFSPSSVHSLLWQRILAAGTTRLDTLDSLRKGQELPFCSLAWENDGGQIQWSMKESKSPKTSSF